MRVRCLHGYFFFEEGSPGDISRFASQYGFDLVPKDWYYTFEHLSDAPDYSFKNLKYVDPLAIATETYQGKPWDVMRKNKLIYDFSDGTIKRIETVLVPLTLFDSRYYSYAYGMLLPGTINKFGQRVTDFTAEFGPEGDRFRYTEVLYDQNI